MKFVAIFITSLMLNTDFCTGNDCCCNTTCTPDPECEGKSSTIHYVLVGIASVIAVILFIAVIMCIIITCVLTKGVRFMIHHFSASETDRANGEHDTMVHHTQMQQNEDVQQPTVEHTPEPQYDSIENEQAPVHYFELEPPQHISTKAKQQNKPQNQGAMAMSKLYSLPELATPMELHGEERNSQNVVNYPREQKQKVSAASLPPSITQHSSIHNKNGSEQEKDEEPLPIYSIPDKSKKSMKTIVEPMEHEERETEQLSRSHTLDSFFNIKPRVTVEEEGGGDKGTPREGSSSPPPPLLPPKPGQTKTKAAEDAAGEGEESVYAEASSKPLQAHSQRKTNNYDEWTKTATATIMGNISPFHLHAHYSQKEQGHIHKRSLSAVDDMKRKEGHSRARLPARTEHDQHYHIALSLLESNEEEEEKLRARLLKNEDRT